MVSSVNCGIACYYVISDHVFHKNFKKYKYILEGWKVNS